MVSACRDCPAACLQARAVTAASQPENLSRFSASSFRLPLAAVGPPPPPPFQESHPAWVKGNALQSNTRKVTSVSCREITSSMDVIPFSKASPPSLALRCPKPPYPPSRELPAAMPRSWAVLGPMLGSCCRVVSSDPAGQGTQGLLSSPPACVLQQVKHRETLHHFSYQFNRKQLMVLTSRQLRVCTFALLQLFRAIHGARRLLYLCERSRVHGEATLWVLSLQTDISTGTIFLCALFSRPERWEPSWAEAEGRLARTGGCWEQDRAEAPQTGQKKWGSMTAVPRASCGLSLHPLGSRGQLPIHSLFQHKQDLQRVGSLSVLYIYFFMPY